MIRKILKQVKSFLRFYSYLLMPLYKRNQSFSTDLKCVCSHSDYKIIYKFPKHSLLLCNNCSLIRNYPLPLSGVCDEKYQKINNEGELHPHQLKLLDEVRSKTQVKDWILDVGCSTGKMMTALMISGYEKIMGIELEKSARDMALKKKLKVVDDWKKIEKHKFRTIYMNHVVEHIPEPIRFLRMLHAYLKKDGYLIIAVPNFDSPLSKRPDWIGFQPDQHYWIFNKKSLTGQLKDCHFVVENVLTFSTPFFENLGIEGDNLILVAKNAR